MPGAEAPRLHPQGGRLDRPPVVAAGAARAPGHPLQRRARPRRGRPYCALTHAGASAPQAHLLVLRAAVDDDGPADALLEPAALPSALNARLGLLQLLSAPLELPLGLAHGGAGLLDPLPGRALALGFALSLRLPRPRLLGLALTLGLFSALRCRRLLLRRSRRRRRRSDPEAAQTHSPPRLRQPPPPHELARLLVRRRGVQGLAHLLEHRGAELPRRPDELLDGLALVARGG